jgi:hypothetical protein
MMNLFNRFIMVLLLLGLIVVLTAVLVFPGQILTVAGQFLVDWGGYFIWIDQQQQLLRLTTSVGIAVIADLILLLLIFLEINPGRKRFVKVEQASGGKAKVSLDSIVRQLLYKLDPLPGVIKVTPHISPKGNKIQARLDVTVTRDKAVPQMADHLISITKQAISEDLGLLIAGEPVLRIKVAEGVQRRPASSPPVSTQTPAADIPIPAPVPPAVPAASEEQDVLLPSPDESKEEKADWA